MFLITNWQSHFIAMMIITYAIIYIYMQIESTILEFKNTGNFSTEYIESLLRQNNNYPLRWAVVDVSDSYFKVSIAKLL